MTGDENRVRVECRLVMATGGEVGWNKFGVFVENFNKSLKFVFG